MRQFVWALKGNKELLSIDLAKMGKCIMLLKDVVLKKHGYSIRVFIPLIVLLFQVAVKASGLTGEYLLSDQWRGISRFYSPLTNAALLTDFNYPSVKGVYSIGSDAPSRLWENEITIPIGLYRSVALSIAAENGYPVQNYSGDFLSDPLNAKSGDPQENDNYSIFLSWASNPVGQFSYGINLKYLYMSNFGSSDKDFSFDLGCTYRIGNHPALGYHRAGLSLINCYPAEAGSISQMRYSSDLSFQYMINLFNSKFDLLSKIDLHDIFSSNVIKKHQQPQSSSYFQFALNTFPFISLSSGFQLTDFEKITNWCLGFKVNAPQINSGRDLSIVYQITNFTSSAINANHSLFYIFEFGKHREEIFARKLALNADINAIDLYNKAMRTYYSGKYWESFFLFKRLLHQFPDFYKNDNATYYSGLCLENLDFREAAVKYLESVKEKYPSSQNIPAADLAIMRIYYRNNDYFNLAQQYQIFQNNAAPDSIRMYAFYLMGEAEMLQKNYNKAVQYFSIIQDPHPIYAYAQYSAAVARYTKDDETYSVFNHLENCISATINDNREEIKNRAFVHSGMLFYEVNTLSKAVAAFRLVDSKSIFYEDALLGLGWAAVKANQWIDCYNSGKSLETYSQRPVLKAEGCLLQSYSLIMQKKYFDAEKSVQKALEIVKNYDGLSEDSIFNRKLLYENTRLLYANLGDIISRDYEAIGNDNESMHNKQIEIKKEIDAYLLFNDESKRIKIFNLSLANIKNDIEFTLAKLKEIIVNLQTGDTEKNIKKDIQLEKQIRQLKNQVEKNK